jgi:hypothetical protein
LWLTEADEIDELEEAVEENNNWAATVPRAFQRFQLRWRRLTRVSFYVMFGASMELEFDNVPYDPAFKDYRTRGVNWRLPLSVVPLVETTPA